MRTLLPILALAAILAPAAAAQGVIQPELAERMAQAAPGERIDAYLVMADRLTLRQLEEEMVGLGPRERRTYVPQRLKAYAATSQAQARALLQQLEAQDRAALTDILWMGNAIFVSAEPSAIEELAALPGVASLHLDAKIPAALAQDVERGRPFEWPGAAAGDGGTPVTVPFADDFESGALGAQWETIMGASGVVAVTGDDGPNGDFHVVLSSTGGTTSAGLILHVDLLGVDDADLQFAHKEFADEDGGSDGIWISDGGPFEKALELSSGATYETYQLDLDSAISAKGMSKTSDFRILFGWSGNGAPPDDGFAFDDVVLDFGLVDPPPPPPTTNIALLQAPQLWEIGIRGEGLLIGNIDSGTDFSHPDLANAAWGNPGEIPANGIDDDGNGYVDDLDGWDFANNGPNVSSFDDHGTNTAGLMVGDGTAGTATGMSPDSKMIACELGDEGDYFLAQQYCVDNGVDVISSSYSYKWPFEPKPNYPMHRVMCEMELAAGVIHANSIGNQGTILSTYPIPWNVSAPGNVPGPFAHPEAEPGGRASVMGCAGILLSPLDALYTSSGQGPAAWEDITPYDPGYEWPQDPAHWDYPYAMGALPGLLKPDACTYTTNITTTGFNQTYDPAFGGTSAATPQLGGGMLLLRDSQPAAMPRHVAAAIELSATDLGPAGKDLRYGAGKLQVFDAARRLQVLGRAQDQTPGLGDPLVIDLFGEPGATVFTYVAGGIADTIGLDFNLSSPFFFLGTFPLDLDGEGQIVGAIPNDPLISGVTVWFQLGAKPQGNDWGKKPFTSVPEAVAIQ